MLLTLLVATVVGALAGLLSGLFGLGGGILMVPLLNLYLQYLDFPPEQSMYYAVGTSLATMVFSALSSSIMHYKKGARVLSYAVKLAPSMMLGSFFGVGLAENISGFFLQYLFAGFSVLMAINIYFRANNHSTVIQKPIPWFILIIFGLGIGLSAGLLGIGGGVLVVPLMVHFGFALPQTAAIAALCTLPTVMMGSLSAILFGANAAFEPPMPHWGYVLWHMALLQGIISVVTAYFGVLGAHQLPNKWLKSILTCLLALIAIIIIPWKSY